MMLSAMISLILSFLALTSATPLSTRGPCKPDFGSPPGFEVSIINKGLGKEWGLQSVPPSIGTRIVAHPASLFNAEFVVRHLPNGKYSIKPIGFPNLRVAATAGNKLDTVATDPNDNAQFWKIHCNQCGTPAQGVFDRGCTIESVANSFLCVEADTSPIKSTVSLKPCSGGLNQKFNFGGA
ncbi:hypothetical protein PILCRDRAFT_615217 [Piloderma croceum F 1598]|uniref:Carbohydrate-binding module family 13 protein n=1 Tax=Piloderma croceum (strain F 1598) TaxID=765440 RepID=A0A0C3EYP4_PILCF|nr:hypothetical protein PILCRDRAFT_615217 [Piloderma croceum F 1598]